MKSTDYCNDLVSAFCFFPDFPSLPLLDLGRSAPSLSSLGSFFLGAGTGAGESSIKKSMMDCESFGLLRPPLVRFSLFSWLDRWTGDRISSIRVRSFLAWKDFRQSLLSFAYDFDKANLSPLDVRPIGEGALSVFLREDKTSWSRNDGELDRGAAVTGYRLAFDCGNVFLESSYSNDNKGLSSTPVSVGFLADVSSSLGFDPLRWKLTNVKKCLVLRKAHCKWLPYEILLLFLWFFNEFRSVQYEVITIVIFIKIRWQLPFFRFTFLWYSVCLVR